MKTKQEKGLSKGSKMSCVRVFVCWEQNKKCQFRIKTGSLAAVSLICGHFPISLVFSLVSTLVPVSRDRN